MNFIGLVTGAKGSLGEEPLDVDGLKWLGFLIQPLYLIGM